MEGELIKLKQKFAEIAWDKNNNNNNNNINKTKQKEKRQEKNDLKKLSQDRNVFGVHDISSCVLKSDLRTTFCFKLNNQYVITLSVMSGRSHNLNVCVPAWVRRP